MTGEELALIGMAMAVAALTVFVGVLIFDHASKATTRTVPGVWAAVLTLWVFLGTAGTLALGAVAVAR
jgi:hypothetical protein